MSYSPTRKNIYNLSRTLLARSQLLERTERRSFVLELAANPSYVEEVSGLHVLARRLIAELADALARPRRQCPRLYFLTDLEVMALMAQPSPDALDVVIAKVSLP